MPSSFDDESFIVMRNTALVQRRIQAIITTITTTKKDAMADSPPNIYNLKLKQIELIEKALKLRNNIEKSIAVLEPLYTINNNNNNINDKNNKNRKKNKKLYELNILAVPGNIIKVKLLLLLLLLFIGVIIIVILFLLLLLLLLLLF